MFGKAILLNLPHVQNHKPTHVVYKCDYHIVFTLKYRFRILTGDAGSAIEQDLRQACAWKEFEIDEMSVQADYKEDE